MATSTEAGGEFGVPGFEGRYDYGGVGNAIILASRLSGEAAAGEILISQRTHAALDGQLATEAAGERQLKGFTRPMATYRVSPPSRETDDALAGSAAEAS